MSRTFALIPAAGKSRRMGRPKLQLVWRGKTILEHAVTALIDGGVTSVLVVMAPGDTEQRVLAEKACAEVLELAQPTAEMRDTIERGLEWIEQKYQPSADDGWLLLPADHPGVDKQVVQAILAARAANPHWSILVPAFENRNGHPVWIGWPHVAGIRRMPAGEGVNIYIRQHMSETFLLPLATPAVLLDLDTPEQFSALDNNE
jgi:CTP:molybdopterin cytidylyltransferase MocA